MTRQITFNIPADVPPLRALCNLPAVKMGRVLQTLNDLVADSRMDNEPIAAIKDRAFKEGEAAQQIISDTIKATLTDKLLEAERKLLTVQERESKSYELGISQNQQIIKYLESDLTQTKQQLATSMDQQQKTFNEGFLTAETSHKSEILYLKEQLGEKKRLEEQVQQLSSLCNNAFGKKSNATEKGQIGENIVAEWISESFPDAIIQDVSKTVSGMDRLIEISKNKIILRVMIEVKNKNKTNKTDREKFESNSRENKHQADAAIFVSLPDGVSIPKRGPLIQMSHCTIPIVYLSQLLGDGGRSLAAVVECLFYMKESDKLDSNFNENMLQTCAEMNKKLRSTIATAHQQIQRGIQTSSDGNLLLIQAQRQIDDINNMFNQWARPGPRDENIHKTKKRKSDSVDIIE